MATRSKVLLCVVLVVFILWMPPKGGIKRRLEEAAGPAASTSTSSSSGLDRGIRSRVGNNATDTAPARGVCARWKAQNLCRMLEGNAACALPGMLSLPSQAQAQAGGLLLKRKPVDW